MAAVLGVLILILIGSLALVSAQVRRSKAKKAEEKAKTGETDPGGRGKKQTA